MKTLIKISEWIAWASAGIGLFSIFCAALSSILPRYQVQASLNEPEIYMFGVDHRVNFFIIASCFFLITISIFVFHLKIYIKKE